MFVACWRADACCSRAHGTHKGLTSPFYGIHSRAAALLPRALGSKAAPTRNHQARLGNCKLSSSKYDQPALYTSEDAFAERSYWDARYQDEPTTFEWYRGYPSLQPILTEHLPKASHILQLGVGTSRLQVDMADDGYMAVTSIDYSPVAIQRLVGGLYPGYPGLSYAVADARSMPQYGDASFGGVLDKGTLDALLCGDSEAADAAALLGEVWRLLQPGAAYVMITSASPRARLPYLLSAATWSRLLVYEVGQQGAMHGPYEAAWLKPDSSSSSNSSSVDVGNGSSSSSNNSTCGSSSSLESWEQQSPKLMQLPRLSYSHLVYVCYK